MAKGAPIAKEDARKANKRGAARLAAVQALYQMDMAGTGLNEILAEFESHWIGREVEGEQYLPAEAAFFRDIVSGVVREQRKLDPLIDEALAKSWPLKRIEAVLRAALRAGAYELDHRRDVPARVVVSEYADVAAAFVERDETGMVNAVLDQLARKLRARIAGSSSPPLGGGRQRQWHDVTPILQEFRRRVLTEDPSLIARYFAPLATHPGALGLVRRRRLHQAAAGLRPGAQDRRHCRRRAFFHRRCARRGGEQGVAREPFRPGRQGRQAARLSVVARADRKRSATTGSPHSPKACAATPCFTAARCSAATPTARRGRSWFPSPCSAACRKGTMVRRAGAKAGDRVFVTGTIGDAALGLRCATAQPGS